MRFFQEMEIMKTICRISIFFSVSMPTGITWFPYKIWTCAQKTFLRIFSLTEKSFYNCGIHGFHILISNGDAFFFFFFLQNVTKCHKMFNNNPVVVDNSTQLIVTLKQLITPTTSAIRLKDEAHWHESCL